ncbi:MAG TPA: thiamine pyrophosphate-dependent enzyme, partial [Kofleriaceae bacterium]|nr:thiamine pyrophosphate-dependent enzyme [Kofleriaceae bacterium]
PIAMPQPALVAGLAAAIAAEPDGVIVAGAMPARFAAARAAVLELARRAGYPIIAEAGSQLRLGPVPDGAVIVHHVDLIPPGELPAPGLVIQLGAEPVAAAWPGWLAKLTASGAARWVLAGHTWNDADASAHGVILGDVAATVAAVRDAVPNLDRPPPSGWRTLDASAGRALDAALAAHPDNEASVLRAALAALPGNAVIQVGNSLPIRVLDQIAASATPHPVLTQRGAAGIDGLIASAAGATWSGRQPVLLVLGDVSFAHDLGGLLAARASRAPFAVLVIDNGGGQIFGGLPIARAELGDRFAEHWLTPPAVDPVAVARALGLDGVRAETPDAVAEAIRAALQRQVPAIIHAPVRASGARDVRRTALERFGG